MITHNIFMKRCLELAKNGLPFAMPNPSVGAVLVFKNQIIGEGFTSPFGDAHGEVNCINSVSIENEKFISNSILYVSLEPCSHFGKTPPCSNLIIEKKIPEVVIGCVDTFSEVAGKGIEKLKNAGIKVTTGILEKECRELNKRFFTFHERNRPFIILKWAHTQEGFVAPIKELHEQERWITGSKTKQFVHQMRANEMAILVGSKTVKMDNPSLTTREVDGKNPLRIVFDKSLELWNSKSQYSIFNKNAETLIMNGERNFVEDNNEGVKLDFNNDVLKQLTNRLKEKNIQSLIVEGGTRTLQLFIEANLWDEAFVFEGNKKFEQGVKGPNFNGEKRSTVKIGKDILTHFINPKSH